MWAAYLTDYADQAVILPLATGMVAGLWVTGWRRGGLAFGFGVGVTLGVMGLLKLLAAACHGLPGLPGVLSPSGHAASAAMLGAAVALLRVRPTAWFAVAAALVLGAVIGWTRLAVGAHSVNEVLLGLAVGTLGAVLTVLLAGVPPARRRRLWTVPCLVLVLTVMHGRHLDAEAGLRNAGGSMAGLCRR